MKGNAELEALCRALDADGDCELELGEVIGRFRLRRERDIEDMEIAQLIPRGVAVVMERFGGSRRNNFRRAGRGRKLLRVSAMKTIGSGTVP